MWRLSDYLYCQVYNSQQLLIQLLLRLLPTFQYTVASRLIIFSFMDFALHNLDFTYHRLFGEFSAEFRRRRAKPTMDNG
jgi:hypothetical protein